MSTNNLENNEQQSTDENSNKNRAFIIWLNAETTSNLCKQKCKNIELILSFINYFSYIFPILITSLLLFSKQSNDNFLSEKYRVLEAFSFFGSLSILIIGLTSILLFKFESKKGEYEVGFRNNLQIASEAKKVYENKIFSELDLLNKLVIMQNQYDGLIEPNISDRKKQKEYKNFLLKHGFNCNGCNNNGSTEPSIWKKIMNKNSKCTKCGSINPLNNT